jgi:hypothetical protein
MEQFQEFSVFSFLLSSFNFIEELDMARINDMLSELGMSAVTDGWVWVSHVGDVCICVCLWMLMDAYGCLWMDGWMDGWMCGNCVADIMNLTLRVVIEYPRIPILLLNEISLFLAAIFSNEYYLASPVRVNIG